MICQPPDWHDDWIVPVHNISGILPTQELNQADDDSRVYKLVGPVLIRQDPVEAKSNVQKRLEFIDGELSRLDSRLRTHEKNAAERQQKVACHCFLTSAFPCSRLTPYTLSTQLYSASTDTAPPLASVRAFAL
jgi:prefoldin beta subunit